MQQRMPVLFTGHGSPQHAIGDNPWRRALQTMGASLPRPRAIVCVSAHWNTKGTLVTDNARQRTIHDFGGFDDELYEIRYEPPGDPALANEIVAALRPSGARASGEWGLDHGAWTALRPMFPAADIPVLQVSLDVTATARAHLDVGRALRPLRDRGVLLVGSGNVTHNLRDAFTRMQRGNTDTPEWAAQFDAAVEAALRARDERALLAMWPSQQGLLAHPTPDHWWPLLHAFGATDERDAVAFPIEGFDLGSLSMRSVRWG
jgi:4,5-DOPA dioxygenase extradiol